MPDFTPVLTITLAAAYKVIQGCMEQSSALGVAACIAVTDPGANLVAFVRMDGAPLLSVQIAQDKAYTVAAFGGLATHEWWQLIKDEPQLLYGIVKTERLIVFGGGVALRIDGHLVGAVGASGGSAEQDQLIAEAGATTLDLGGQ